MILEPPLFLLWYDFSKWLLNKAEKFPKKIRFSFSNRIDNLALDIFEGIIEARYSKNKKEILRRIDLSLEKLRLLLRMCHDIIKSQLRRKVKDADLLRLLDVFIDHPVPWTETGKGIPIGNLTSQHFANFYLTGLDHFIKEYLRIEGYVRYMDDLVLFDDEKETLWDACMRIERYLKENLRLRIKSGGLLLASVYQGLPFLGFRLASSRQRPDALGSRTHRQRQSPDHRPGPVPRNNRGQI